MNQTEFCVIHNQKENCHYDPSQQIIYLCVKWALGFFAVGQFALKKKKNLTQLNQTFFMTTKYPTAKNSCTHVRGFFAVNFFFSHQNERVSASHGHVWTVHRNLLLVLRFLCTLFWFLIQPESDCIHQFPINSTSTGVCFRIIRKMVDTIHFLLI